MIGLFGGGFDPIHYGHITCIKHALNTLKLQELFLLPYAKSPHKTHCLFSDLDRLHLLNLAITHIQNSSLDIDKYTKISIDTREIKNSSSTSRTIDTLKNIKKDYPNQTICLLIGMDAFNQLNTWKTYQELSHYCHLLVFKRPQHLITTAKMANFIPTTYINDLQNSHYGQLLFLNQEQIDISSSIIRDKIIHKQELSTLLPEALIQYIHQINYVR